VHERGPAPRVADDKDRFFHLDLPVVEKEDLIDQTEKEDDKSKNGPQENEKKSPQEAPYGKVLDALEIDDLKERLEVDV
jgi:hypothetical protein